MKQEQANNQSSRQTKAANGQWMPESGAFAEIQEQVMDTARGAYDAIVDVSAETLTRANKRASRMIRQYPVQAAAGALAVGFLFGAMIARRKS